MKKLIYLGILIMGFNFAACVPAVAQTNSPTTLVKTTGGAVVDTVKGTGTGYLYVNVKSDEWRTLGFHVTTTRVSSAMSGKYQLQGSNDSLTWFNTAAGDTIHITDGATDQGFCAVTPVYWYWYRLKKAGVSGDTIIMKAKVMPRK